MKRLVTTLVSLIATTSAFATTVVPTRYEAGHFFATPTLASGEVLRLLVDTGGGGATWALPASITTRLHLAAARCPQGNDFVEPPRFAPGKALPDLNPRGCAKVGVLPDGFMTAMTQGLVGGWYLAAGTWTFDYPERRLVLEGPHLKPDTQAHPVTLGFPSDAKGGLAAPYPRITVGIAGERIDLLLDTGATAHPTDAARAIQKTEVAPNGYAGGSYITTSVMDRWHKAHPDWPLVDAADDLFGATRTTRSIRVPSVEIAGWSTGPVWFVERPDKAFNDEGMSQYMDNEVHGAAGGNIYAPFRMTIDYPNRKAWFTCVTHCNRVAQGGH